MPSRLSKIFLSGKEKDAAAEAEHSIRSSSGSDAPPVYEERETLDPDNGLPPPDVTAGFSNLKISSHGDGCNVCLLISSSFTISATPILRTCHMYQVTWNRAV